MRVQEVQLAGSHLDVNQTPVLCFRLPRGLVEPFSKEGSSTLETFHHGQQALFGVPGHLPADALLNVADAG